MASSLDGTWRGELNYQDNLSMVIGITIEDGEATFASPNQGLYAQPVSAFEVDGDTVTVQVAELNLAFRGVVSHERMVGEFTQGQSFPLTLTRLDATALQRLQYEGQYAGALDVNGNELPLQVNIAVLVDGYLGTLDSPAQQTFGLPLAEVKIDAMRLSFTSPIIKAAYAGEAQSEGSYVGAWHQGLPMPLTLTRVTEDTPAPQVKQHDFGEFGGATAIISGGDPQVNYFGEHDSQTLYEIGSVSKTIVSYLLASAVVEGKVALTTPLQRFFPSAPEGITLQSLATHTSGLPRLPADLFAQATGHDPYAHYDRQMLAQALASVELHNKGHLYSNFAVGALAEALAVAYDMSFAELVRKRVFKPFNMTSAYVATPDAPHREALAIPHDTLGNVVSPWRFQALAGAGAVVATLPDMIAYVQGLNQALADSPQLREVLLTPRADFGDCCQQALGWFLQEDDDGNTFVWHNGQTAGFSSYVGFYPDGSRAVIFLNNQARPMNAEAQQRLTDR
ncbi:serine hydrolase domain-containing protein [Pseudidiomarina insulisalsae]|nr:serine hydrolase domain-containing protein [Pseudidiomarina insulisalsae]